MKQFFSDNGTNFVGAHNELVTAVAHMDKEAIEKWSRDNGLNWSFNPPSASHMGGAWERMIKSIHKVLAGLLAEFQGRLDEDSFTPCYVKLRLLLTPDLLPQWL